MNSWTEQRVRDLLLQLATVPQAARGTLLGAQAGLLLRQLDPGFHSGVLGDRRLVDMLQRFPDVVHIAHDGAHGDIMIRFDAAAEANPLEVDRLAVERQMWQALVSPRVRETWFLDLATQDLVMVELDEAREPVRGSGPADEPHRYLEVPRVDQDVLRRALEAWVEQLPGTGPEREQLLSLLDADDWYGPFRTACDALGKAEWKDVHRAAVVEEFRAWAARHGIEARRFLWTRRAPARARHSPSPSAGSPRKRDIRALVQRAVSRMSDEELLDLRIPLRYLID